jgi:hypothetical protein
MRIAMLQVPASWRPPGLSECRSGEALSVFGRARMTEWTGCDGNSGTACRDRGADHDLPAATAGRRGAGTATGLGIPTAASGWRRSRAAGLWHGPSAMTGNERATVTFFQSAFAKQKWQRELTLPDLADLIRNTSRSSKDQLPWLKLARFGNARTPKGSYRHDRNVIAITGCEADYDGELVPFDDAVDVAAKADLRALLYTSPSHIPERPRWRIIAPTSREYPPVERARWLARINGLYGGIFERESWTLSQSYYFGSINRAASHLVEILDGEAIDRLDDLDLIAIGPAAATTTRAVAALDGSEARDDAELVRRIVTGEGSTPSYALWPLDTWAAACKPRPSRRRCAV